MAKITKATRHGLWIPASAGMTMGRYKETRTARPRLPRALRQQPARAFSAENAAAKSEAKRKTYKHLIALTRDKWLANDPMRTHSGCFLSNLTG